MVLCQGILLVRKSGLYPKALGLIRHSANTRSASHKNHGKCKWRKSSLGKPPLRAASIELIVVCFGAEQWSEHFTFSKTEPSPLPFQRASAGLPFVGRSLRCAWLLCDVLLLKIQ